VTALKLNVAGVPRKRQVKSEIAKRRRQGDVALSIDKDAVLRGEFGAQVSRTPQVARIGQRVEEGDARQRPQGLDHLGQSSQRDLRADRENLRSQFACRGGVRNRLAVRGPIPRAKRLAI
jgi:hypothetical protein